MSKKVDLNLQLRRLYAASAGLFAILAVVAGVVMQPATYQVVLGYLTSDQLASRAVGTTVFARGQQAVMDVELRWVLVGLLILSAILPVLYLTRLAAQNKKAIKEKALAWRWLDLAITGSLLLAVSALLTGVQDLLVLVVVIGLGVLAAGAWRLAERDNVKARKPALLNYWIGVYVAALPWILIFGYMLTTLFYGAVRSPWYVYAAIAVVLLGFVGYALNQRFQYEGKRKQWKDYLFVERNYAVLNIAMKAVFAVVLIVGLSS
jgi:hypothetical protein